MQTDTSPFQSVIGLGQFKAEFSTGKGRRWTSLITGVVLLGIAGVLVLVAAYVGYDTYINRGLIKIAEAVALPLIFAGLAFLLAVISLFTTWRNWNMAAALYENGVALNSSKGMQQVPWTDIASVWQAVTKHYYNGIYTGTTHIYTVQTNAGEKLVFNDTLGKNVEELGRAIQSGAANALFPRYWQMYQDGQKLTFGPLALDKQKLYAGRKELTWDEIPVVKIASGNISIKKDGKGWFNWTAVSVPQIPNFYIFYEIVSRITKVE